MTKTGILLAAVFIVGGAVIFWQQVMPAAPDSDHSMTPPDMSAVKDGDALAQVTLPSELSTNALIGKRAFEAKCVACHGVNAAGQNGVAPPLVHKIYEPSHHGDASFLSAANNGVRAHHWKFGDMPPVEGLTDADVKMVVVYVRELQRANGIN